LLPACQVKCFFDWSDCPTVHGPSHASRRGVACVKARDRTPRPRRRAATEKTHRHTRSAVPRSLELGYSAGTQEKSSSCPNLRRWGMPTCKRFSLKAWSRCTELSRPDTTMDKAADQHDHARAAIISEPPAHDPVGEVNAFLIARRQSGGHAGAAALQGAGLRAQILVFNSGAPLDNEQKPACRYARREAVVKRTERNLP